MSLPTVAALCLWRNDAHRELESRMEHLLGLCGSTTLARVRWVWVVGDSTDATEEALRVRAARARAAGLDVVVVRADTGLADADAVGKEPVEAVRLRRSSLSFSVALDQVVDSDTYVLLHESDLRGPPTLVDRLVGSGFCPVAGWVMLRLGARQVFYDIWAYRGLDGVKFGNDPPYHRDYKSDRPFEVQSVGSCFLMHAEDIRAGVRCSRYGVLDLCKQVRARNRRIWVLPDLIIEQPAQLWTWATGVEV